MPLKQIRLTCGHAPFFQTPIPQAGDEIYCPRCADVHLVEYAPPALAGWQWSCMDIECKRHGATNYGDTERAKRSCWQRGLAHAARKGHDVVIVHDGSAVHTTKSAEFIPKLF